MARPKSRTSVHPSRATSIYVRENAETDDALKTLVLALKKTRILGKANQEDVVGLSWHYLNTIDPRTLAKSLLPFVPIVTGYSYEELGLKPPEQQSSSGTAPVSRLPPRGPRAGYPHPKRGGSSSQGSG